MSVRVGGELYPMNWSEGGVWTSDLIDTAEKEYRFCVCRNGRVIRDEWQSHQIQGDQPEQHEAWIDCPIEGCRFPRRHTYEAFDDPFFRAAGTVVPVFALRSSRDYGIGDFGDLAYFVEWLHKTGQKVLQLLPITDTTVCGDWHESYPYNPVSAFALNPLYMNLDAYYLYDLEEGREELNACKQIDYPRVFKLKMEAIARVYQIKLKSDVPYGYKAFMRKNAYWLDDYCNFKAEIARKQRLDKNTAYGKVARKPEFYAWIQYTLFHQLEIVAKIARDKRVVLKGDLPIGVGSHSADAWKHPELFNLDSTAGAPPDYFSADGQNWGFPTYNWEAMERDGFRWWRERLKLMSKYFGAYRIDHILGFFRIWEIPKDEKSGKAGHFNPALPYNAAEIEGLPIEGLFHEDPRHPGMYQPLISPDTSALSMEQKQRFDALWEDFFFHRNEAFWEKGAEKKLQALLDASGMLACGEDLGMVPASVNPLMEREGILSLEMPNMDKGRPWPVNAVCASSSHDMPTLRMQMRDELGEDPSPEQVRSRLEGYLSAAPMLAIFPLQDWIAMDKKLRCDRRDIDSERINDPSNPDNRWCYRIDFDIFDLIIDRKLIKTIRGMLERTNRR